MANLQQLRAHESLNTDSAATWSGSATQTTVTGLSTIDVSGYHTIHFQITQDIYFHFDTSTTDGITTAHALYLKGGDTIYSLKIPLALGDTIYFQQKRVSADGEIHYVLA
tara:strand:+ start:243 stop:572 length:330 start_codon:yes stop_codon:yes gene_type:complete